VKIIGWGNEIINGEKKKYWLCVNSWGQQFENDDGTFKFIRGVNDCEFEASVVTGYKTSKILYSNNEIFILFIILIYRFNFTLNGINYKGCINLIGNIQNDCYGISPGEASFIGVDSNNRYIKFGKIDDNVLFDYREDKKGKKFFQQTLSFGDYCNIDNFDDNDDYYNLKYIYNCDSNITGNPTFIFNEDKDDKCKFTIYIS
jgi:hypothetical protein